MTNKKDIIWITGSSGFLGQDIISFFKKKFQIYSLSKVNKNANFYFDYENEFYVNKFIADYGKPKYVLHLGWSDVDKNLSKNHYEYNLPSSLRFFKNLINNDVKNIIFFGTVDEYEGCKGNFDESYSSTKYTNKYAGAKFNVAKKTYEMIRNTDVKFTHLRLFNTYGSNKQETSLVKYIYRNQNLKKIYLSDCNYFRDFIYIKDVLNCLELILRNPFLGTLNIGSGISENLRDFIKIYSKHLGIDFSKFEFGYKEKPSSELMVPSKPASLTKIKKYFKWQPYYNLDEGLKDMVKTLKKNGIQR